MSDSTNPELTQAIERFENKELGPGAGVAAVSHVETALGVKLPASYRWFLRQYGWARFAHEELCGVGDALPAHLDVVENTQFERANDAKMPASLVTILADGAGNHYCLDTKRVTGRDECAVVFWDHERQASDPVADDFGRWLIARLEQLSAPPDMSWQE